MGFLPITGDAGVLATLLGVCAFFFWLERFTNWKLFQFVPPLVFIYLVPVILANTGVLPEKSAAYDVVGSYVLPMMLVLMLLNVDVGGAVRVMGRGVFVMLAGSVGVVVGATVGMAVVQRWVGDDAWKAYGALSGSWVGGTGNMAAAGKALEASEADLALAVLADTTILLIWLPVLLGSKRFAARFASFTQVDPERVARMEAAAATPDGPPPRSATYRDYLSLLFVAFAVTAFARAAAERLPILPPYVTGGTWLVLTVTLLGIAGSFTPLKRIPASHELGMALIFLFMANIGATANLEHVADQAIPFIIGAAICIAIHGLFCVGSAWLLRVDIHTAAIASAANIGGPATATCVAAHHRDTLMPAAVMMALLGYAIGNFAGYGAGLLCAKVSGH
jgi:uncharacterized membrane protein